jgi:CBS domain-containing protein
MQEVSIATDFLLTVPPLNTLEAGELDRLARKLGAAYYPRGKVIFSHGGSSGLAVIRKGAVRLLDRENRFLEKRSEGELVGHRIYFHGELKEYALEAEEDCLLWHLADTDFSALCERFPRVSEYFSSQPKARLSSAAQLPIAANHVRDLLRRAAVTVDSQASIREAARLMSANNVSSVLVMHRDELSGIVTDKDLRQRVIVAEKDPGASVMSVMTKAPVSLAAEAGTDEALLLMMRENFHHLPIIEDGQPIGLLTAGDLLRSQAEHPLRLVRDIRRADSAEELVLLSHRFPPLFGRMVVLGRDVEHIGRMVTAINDAFTVRLIQFAEIELGPPPVPYAWVVFGSQAREEQTASTDQDNGLILEREALGDEVEYFSQLSRIVCEGLDRMGYSFCPGEIMALNVEWRVSLDCWKRHFNRWIDEPEPKSLMHSSIFFDMRCVHGRKKLVEELQEHACSRARENRIFRRFMAGNVLQHRPPLGFFRRFVQEDDGSHSEGLNLKHRGLVPITDLVRMRALEGGITKANTFSRIRRAVAEGVMNANDAASLRDALVLINRVRLEHQAEQMAAGHEPTHFVPPNELSPLMRRNLKAAFMLVIEAQNALAHRYQVH